MKEKIDDYFKTKKEVHDAFGYVEDWVSIPLEDFRYYYWTADDQSVLYADSEEDFANEGYYEASIYTQRFLPKWVYETTHFTMICMDTHTDGNKYLGIFDNSMHVARDFVEDLINKED